VKNKKKEGDIEKPKWKAERMGRAIEKEIGPLKKRSGH